uniref:CUB domain-containing protein n=1 Tax=Bombyx mori TaxID=7091 RepID=A0A8R2M7W2_BOMMO|nr:uncharacterized protein LOC119630688 isoform X2 [Bombyx mori]
MWANIIHVKIVIICLVILMLVYCDCNVKKGAKIRFKKNGDIDKRKNTSIKNKANDTFKNDARGFFGGSLFSFSKVLNFFPVGGERECQPTGFNIAKAGICLNAYDCRQRDGRAAGDCAHGLGVCCVFEVTCGGVVQNNLTYFMSPEFPELWSGEEDCNITIDKAFAGIMQLRIDFVHFTIGQPNRTTGECDEDAMILGDGETKFVLCGQNPGQHFYYTLSSNSERREAGDLAGSKSTQLSMRMRALDTPRLWLMRLAQMPLANSAPHDCLQYYTENNGTIKTFNYAKNGRHLADHEYRSCVRRNSGFCSIRYAPCNEHSFRIGPRGNRPGPTEPTEIPTYPGASASSGISTTAPISSAADNQTIQTQNATEPDEVMPAEDNQSEEDDLEGSGMDPQIEASPPVTRPNTLSRTGRAHIRWSPYTQYLNEDDKIRYFGYGTFGIGLKGFGRQRCEDRITVPCENEYFVSSSAWGGGVCDPHHCGGSFCPGLPAARCWVETSSTPFAVSVHLGPPTPKLSPEDNIGACLRYVQLPCDA